VAKIIPFPKPKPKLIVFNLREFLALGKSPVPPVGSTITQEEWDRFTAKFNADKLPSEP
jgi:hypothetical protein